MAPRDLPERQVSSWVGVAVIPNFRDCSGSRLVLLDPLERVLVLPGSDVCRSVDPVEAEYLFARAFEELDQRLAEGTLYAGLRSAAILRQMFADQHTLIAQAKRGSLTKQPSPLRSFTKGNRLPAGGLCFRRGTHPVYDPPG